MSDAELTELQQLRLAVDRNSRQTRRLVTQLKVHMESHKASDKKLSDVADEVLGKGGLKDQVTGWKAVLGFVGVACAAVGALFVKYWPWKSGG